MSFWRVVTQLSCLIWRTHLNLKILFNKYQKLLFKLIVALDPQVQYSKVFLGMTFGSCFHFWPNSEQIKHYVFPAMNPGNSFFFKLNAFLCCPRTLYHIHNWQRDRRGEGGLFTWEEMCFCLVLNPQCHTEETVLRPLSLRWCIWKHHRRFLNAILKVFKLSSSLCQWGSLGAWT